MVKIHKDFNTPPEILNKKGAITQIKKACESKKAETHYSSYSATDVIIALKELYQDKCAYCEKKISISHELLDGTITKEELLHHIDHYRPKGSVRDDKKHQGYYWLGNEWSNLLLSCPECNSIYKKEQFPVSGVRLYNYHPFEESGTFSRENLKADATILLNENPLLLHPEIDNPDEHLAFNEMGKIIGKTYKGNITIKICGLDRLDSRREAKIREIKTDIENVMLNIPKNAISLFLEVIFSKLKKDIEISKEYSFWHSYLFNNFIDVIAPHINENIRPFVVDCFSKYRHS